MPFNLMDYPEAFVPPVRRTRVSAWHYHLPLAPILVKLLRPRVFVELGTHAGDSYMAFCNAVKNLQLECKCTAVDTWQGDPHSGPYGPEILQNLRQVHDPLVGQFSRLLQTTFDDAALSFATGSVDLLHIDGLHTYEAVKHDFENWLPKLSDRGVVVFHDTAERQAGFGVWKVWEEVSAGRPNVHLPYGHGLGVLAVGAQVPAAFLEFLSEVNCNPSLPAILENLGGVVKLLDELDFAVGGVMACQNLVNQWRTRMGQPIRHPDNVVYTGNPGTRTLGTRLTEDLYQMANDALNLAGELARRQQIPPAPAK